MIAEVVAAGAVVLAKFAAAGQRLADAASACDQALAGEGNAGAVAFRAVTDGDSTVWRAAL